MPKRSFVPCCVREEGNAEVPGTQSLVFGGGCRESCLPAGMAMDASSWRRLFKGAALSPRDEVRQPLCDCSTLLQGGYGHQVPL